MQDFSKGHIDIYRDYEDFYKRLTDKADRIHNAVSLIIKYVPSKDTCIRLESIGIDFLEMSYMLHPVFGEEHTSIATQLTFTLKELKAITQGVVIKGILNPESKIFFDAELDLYMSILRDYDDSHARTTDQKQEGIISPLFTQDFFGGRLTNQFSLTEKNKESEKQQSPHKQDAFEKDTDKLTSQKSLQQNTESMSFNKNETKPAKGHSLTQNNSQGQLSEKKKTDVVDRLNRKTSILNFIKQNKEAQIKDILTYIGDCSEKTIQRELNELIKDGLLKKEGDRRWSKYSLLKDIR